VTLKLELPFYVKFSLLRTALSKITLLTYRRTFSQNIFVVSRDKQICAEVTVTRRIFGIRERTADLS